MLRVSALVIRRRDPAQPTNRSLRPRQGGFTLVELLAVIAIISIMSSMAIPNFLTIRQAANETSALAWLGTIGKAEEVYRAKNLGGAYTYATLAQLEAQKIVPWTATGVYQKAGYQFANLLAIPTASQWGVSAQPLAPLSGNRAMAVTNDGQIRTTANGVVVAPTTIAAALALPVVK